VGELVNAMGAGGPGQAPEDPVTVDNRGLLCAQGILRLMRALGPLPPGQLIRVLSTDPAAEHDYPAWCGNTGHRFLRHERDGRLVVSFLRKRAA
jgi:tRNA 2-thiouridine synthesizing protein A